MILLCAHSDTVFPAPAPILMNGAYRGLLDNALGVFASQAVIYRNRSLLRLVHEGRLGVFHYPYEEFLVELPTHTYHPDLAIVVDVVSGKKYEGFDGVIENNTLKREKTDLRDFFVKEGYNVSVKNFTGEADDEDEGFLWHDIDVPVMTLLLPIDSPVDGVYGWHRPDCSCPVVRFDRFLDVLTRLICYFSEDYAKKEQ